MNRAEENEIPAYQVRRATLEDLPQLKALWQSARLADPELEKRFTEFQVAVAPDGQLVACTGLQIQKQHGLIHSEAFADPERGPEIRPVLWQRILTVAKNNGLIRLWTQPTTFFYREQGMTDVDDTERAKFPAGFGSPAGDWVSLRLKEENQNALTLEKEFEIFSQAQRLESERVMGQAKTLRLIAYLLLIAVLGGLAALAMMYGRLRKQRK